MTEQFLTAFDIERLSHEVWQAFALPDDNSMEMRLAGFASDEADASGCRVRLVRRKSQRGFVCHKLDGPGAGSEIAIALGPANASGWPTRVSVSLTPAGGSSWAGEEARALWEQSVVDLRVFLERRVVLPAAGLPANLGLEMIPGALGLEVISVEDGGPGARCGLQAGDVLIALAGARILDHRQLLTACAIVSKCESATVTWLRAEKVIEARIRCRT